MPSFLATDFTWFIQLDVFFPIPFPSTFSNCFFTCFVDTFLVALLILSVMIPSPIIFSAMGFFTVGILSLRPEAAKTSLIAVVCACPANAGILVIY